jgi:3-deoxy-D-manno-octulosonic-acid transferase
MLASSREGEEARFFKEILALAQYGEASEAIKNIAKNIVWMVVPRHPQRFDDVALMAQSLGFEVVRRSHWPAQDCQAVNSGQVIVGDSLGEMSCYYGAADVALLGGSFEPLGGQNLIEAAACGCPIILGTSTFNFEQAADLAVEAGAAIRVTDMQQGVLSAINFLAQPTSLQMMRQASMAFVGQHQGAAKQTAQAVLKLAGLHT